MGFITIMTSYLEEMDTLEHVILYCIATNEVCSKTGLQKMPPSYTSLAIGNTTIELLILIDKYLNNFSNNQNG